MKAQVKSTAIFSKCKTYRYVLTRTWNDDEPKVLFVALNPSTADAVADDPTVRRCVSFARDWGFGGILIANLFALRSPDPKILTLSEDPIGPRNDWWLNRLSIDCQLTIAAWGIHGKISDRANSVLPKLTNVHHLGLTREGHPRHPLYLPKTIRPARL
jgi:hypothetical protein